ncbi:hypothetical protein KAI87_14460, partial [Myxococcota bacterium]|nr:hypothetical protein [Myxococcota bacterium]
MTNPFFSAPPRRVLLLPLFVVTGLTLIPITPAHAEKPKVVVLEIKANGLAPEEAKTLGVNLVNIIAAEVDKLGYDVFSSNDIKSMLAMDEQKMLMGCSDVSCLAEIGGALGSELMVNTTLGKMGDSFILSLTLV